MMHVLIAQGTVTVDPTLLMVMQWSVIVAAAAIVIQTLLLFAMFLATRSMKNQVSALTAKAGPVTENARQFLESARETLTEVRGYARDYAAKGNEVLEMTQRQLTRVDELAAEATSRTRAQMDRVEMVLDDTINRFQETTTLLQNGVVRPLRQISGITLGVRTALGIILGARRTTVEKATHDEEMFI